MREYQVELVVITGQNFPKIGEIVPSDRSFSGEAQITEVVPHQTIDEWLNGETVIRASLTLMLI